MQLMKCDCCLNERMCAPVKCAWAPDPAKEYMGLPPVNVCAVCLTNNEARAQVGHWAYPEQPENSSLDYHRRVTSYIKAAVPILS